MLPDLIHEISKHIRTEDKFYLLRAEPKYYNVVRLSTSEKYQILIWTCANLIPLLELLDYLLCDSVVDPALKNNAVFRWSCYDGNEKVARRLLKDPRVDPSDADNWALRFACCKERESVVELLLKDGRADPCTHDKALLNTSSPLIKKMLLRDPRMQEKN